MKWDNRKTLMILVGVGLFLAGAKIIYLFFNVFNILDVVVFLGAGFVLGKKVAGGHWAWGLVLALPCLFLDSYFVYRNGYSNIASGVGTSYLIALLLVPLAACLGVALSARRSPASEYPA